MVDILVEQAIYHRGAGESPRLQSCSSGFIESVPRAVEQLLLDFGERPTGIPCPAAIFAQPLDDEFVAIVQVADLPSSSSQPLLGFYVLLIPHAAYTRWLGDPFRVADLFPPPWNQIGSELPTLSLSAERLPRRTVAEVQQVLKRVKAGALREDEDPTTVELSVDNAESPALLGGVQVLVDGGKLAFLRRAPDPGLIRGLWTLLPDRTRCEVWPATFAFSNALGFDAVVLPRRGDEDLTCYTTEEQAADYPAGRYELNLQTAAESGDQAALDVLFGRRSSRDTLRMAIIMMVVLSIALLFLRTWEPTTPAPSPMTLSPMQRENAAITAAMAANGDPWTALALHEFRRHREAERFAAAAAIVTSDNPFAAAVQARSAYARYVEIWRAVE